MSKYISSGTWIDGRAAARILSVCSPRVVARLADDGLIGVRSIPHTREIYRRADVERLAASYAQPSS